ncbi:hypothetical protein DL93DRAFT_2094950 [Clavulina sp. PMI_390]|nr:hypothetical protein DL93DRAFT_2094950 [Clavulina sp. PMI_390]
MTQSSASDLASNEAEEQDCWDAEVERTLRELANTQEYEKLWDFILVFRNKTHYVSKTHVVRSANSDVALVVTWEPYYQGAIGQRNFAAEALSNYIPGRCVEIYSVGTVISFDAPKYGESCHNWVHTILEPEGRRHLLKAFSEAWRLTIGHQWTPDDAPVMEKAFEYLDTPRWKPFRPNELHRHVGQGDPTSLHESHRTHHREYAIYLSLFPLPARSAISPYPTRSARKAGRQLFKRGESIDWKNTFVDVPVDIALQIVEYLDIIELRAFALANATCNRVANRRLWRYFCFAWSEHQDESLLAEKFSALTRLPSRTACIRSFAMICGWSWTDKRIALFKKALSFMTNLQDLVLLEPPRFYGAGALRGGDYSPIFPILIAASQAAAAGDSRGHRPLQLKRFQTSMLLRKTSADLLRFLHSQPRIKQLSGTSTHPNCLRSVPLDILPRLEALETPDIRTAVAWLTHRPIKILKIRVLHACNSFESLIEALNAMESPLELLHVVQHKCSCRRNANPSELLKTLGEIGCPIESLILPWYRVWRGVGDKELRYLSSFPHLSSLEVAGFRAIPWYDANPTLKGVDDQHPIPWLDLLPVKIGRVMFAKIQYTRRIGNDGGSKWVKEPGT